MGILIAGGLINLFFMVFKPQVHPLLVLFVYSIPSNSAVSLFPHEPVLVHYGTMHNPWLLAAITSVSTICAAYLDYRIFVPILNLDALEGFKRGRIYRTTIRYFWKFPFWIIVIAGFTPVPFVIVKALAFSSRYPLGRYLWAVLVGRFPRYYLLALMGHVYHVPSWVLIIIFVALFVYFATRPGMLPWRWRESDAGEPLQGDERRDLKGGE